MFKSPLKKYRSSVVKCWIVEQLPNLKVSSIGDWGELYLCLGSKQGWAVYSLVDVIGRPNAGSLENCTFKLPNNLVSHCLSSPKTIEVMGQSLRLSTHLVNSALAGPHDSKFYGHTPSVVNKLRFAYRNGLPPLWPQTLTPLMLAWITGGCGYVSQQSLLTCRPPHPFSHLI